MTKLPHGIRGVAASSRQACAQNLRRTGVVRTAPQLCQRRFLVEARRLTKRVSRDRSPLSLLSIANDWILNNDTRTPRRPAPPPPAAKRAATPKLAPPARRLKSACAAPATAPRSAAAGPPAIRTTRPRARTRRRRRPRPCPGSGRPSRARRLSVGTLQLAQLRAERRQDGHFS